MLKLIFTGVGGQGIITAGIVLAETVVIEEGRHATQSQSYGAEARGGLTRTDVIISDSEVLFPKIEQAHVLATLHQRGYLAHSNTLRPGGILIYDENAVVVDEKTDARRIPMPILESGRSANIALLGIVCALTSAVTPESVRRVLFRRYGEDSANLDAFDRGLTLVSERGFAALSVGDRI
ncbi:MAG: 2-oxoacid:acceptor oxidoreductase family protein [Spirochaetaceae bacterium]|nr:2-oxoacid:acceptor oxidoreductase family protein [Spirochaetaceae bacterium]